jgi:hypothetical protein
MVVESAPKDCKSEMIASTCDWVSCACAVGAIASIETAITRPVATAATFVVALEVIDITIVIFVRHVLPARN